MNGATLTGMNLTYQTLIPFSDHKNYQLSVGTVTLLLPEELPLDFNTTMGCCYAQADGTSVLEVEIREPETETFLLEYRKLGILPAQFTYELFSSRHASATIAEIYTELYQIHSEVTIPLTLTSVHLLFSDGSILDYSDRIGIHALWQLAEVV